MGKERDSKGRFVKGNKEGFTTDTARQNGQKGAMASNVARKEKRLLKEVLRDILLEKVEMVDGSGQRMSLTKQEVIVANVLNRMQKKGTPKDLKIIAEVLGEMEINVNVRESEKPKIVFDDGEDE